MFQYVQRLMDAATLAPHGICLLWRPELIWTHAVSDALIGLAYFSIPVALVTFIRKRRDLAFSWMFWCFAAFILACGSTHFFAIWTLWYPDYGVEALVKIFTAAVSVLTAVLLWPLLPKALALPSPAQLRASNASLQSRILERDAALSALERETREKLQTQELLRQSQKMEALGQLTGGVAHDFNNLLTVVIANLDRIERRAPAETVDIRRAAGQALTAAQRASDLTAQLLAFARKQQLEPTIQNVNVLIEQTTALLRRTLGEHILLETDLDPALGFARIDANQAETALVNLIVNARDAMPSGGTILVRTRNVESPASAEPRGGDFIRIEVADTGYGMAQEIVEHAFEPFFTTKPLGRGTGLGLSQVYGFITQSGGFVQIQSTPGKGTTVVIDLPRAASAAEASPTLQRTGHAE
jgi:signal transduction histidine kinase